ncbi:MAG: hypothetical protein OEZ16_11860 [Chromatiales bacterium]|nr:hypothetical protein [Chromatiales bacterium]
MDSLQRLSSQSGAEQSPELQGVNRERVVPLLHEFVTMVESDLGRARQLAEELAGLFAGSVQAKKFSRVDDALHDYDSDRAIELAQQIIEEIE